MQEQKRRKIMFRCPLCGRLGYVDHLVLSFPVVFYIRRGLGKGHGFAFWMFHDEKLEKQVKDKIKMLYALYFGGVDIIHENGYRSMIGPGYDYFINRGYDFVVEGGKEVRIDE